MARSKAQIGTLREKPLHRSLKEWCAQPGDRFEVAVEGYVVDVVRGQQLIEIQTRGFSSMRSKLVALLAAGHPVRIVHPIAAEKWIVKVSDDGEILDRRKSPKHGVVYDIFAELVSFPGLVAEDGLEIEVILTCEEEYRHHTPGRSWRRKGWSIKEKHLIEVSDSTILGSVDDMAALLPDGLSDPFTTAHIAELLGVQRRVAQQMAYCLRETGAIEAVGKTQNAVEYSRCHSTQT